MVRLLTALVLAACVAGVLGDLYMHNPRGSNDRNCERNENRNNGNRLFDSQNNDKGGYACPRANGVAGGDTPQMFYYTGSKLMIEWTNQHSCGNNPVVKCEMVFQYMCSEYEVNGDGDSVSIYEPDHPWYHLVNPWIRDGWNDGQPATDRMDADDIDDPAFGYHETYEYYRACTTRRRNNGLWVADQRVSSTGDATRTRQNPNGARRGWECPEERDYYPYWHPTPWKDIAVLTYNTNRCDWYKSESQNRQKKFWCREPVEDSPGEWDWSEQNTETGCLSHGGTWVEVPKWGIPAPECKNAPWTRDNHLGNSKGGMASSYNWTIPSHMSGDADRCVLRVRYNITTAETKWDMDARYNGKENSPVIQDPFKEVAGHNLSMAVNTNQFGRTFQDRSYVFTIKKRGNEVGSGTIHNLNVRGKRGNIVQTYPAVEYDFVPNYLWVQQDDYIHFQWTGSDYNPNRAPNNGEGGPEFDGNQRADRHNIVPVAKGDHIAATDESNWFGTMSKQQMISLAYVDQDITDCVEYDILATRHNNNQADMERDPGNCMKLNRAIQPYFNLGAVKMTSTGTWTYMSSRNNNFSNRSQKAAISVKPKLTDAEIAGIAVGVIAVTTFAAVGGGYTWSKRYPNGKVAQAMSRLPVLNKH